MTNEHTPLLSSSSPLQAPRNPSFPSYPFPPSIPPSSPLRRYRLALGIPIPPSLSQPPSPLPFPLSLFRPHPRPSKPTGLYASILSTQSTRRTQYILIELLYYVALSLQIILGAVLTALGPGAADHTTSITVLGVVNTATAGVLALLKGQGLPETLRREEMAMRTVRGWVEEWDVRLGVWEGGAGSGTVGGNVGDGGEGGDGVGGGRRLYLSDEELDKLVQRAFAKFEAARDRADLFHPSLNDAGQGNGNMLPVPGTGDVGTGGGVAAGAGAGAGGPVPVVDGGAVEAPLEPLPGTGDGTGNTGNEPAGTGTGTVTGTVTGTGAETVNRNGNASGSGSGSGGPVRLTAAG